MAMGLAAILASSLAAPAHARPEWRDQREWVVQRDEHGKQQGERKQRENQGRQERHDGRRQESGRRDSHKGVLTRDEAARRAQRQYGGRVLSVDLLQSEDAPARYRIKLLSDGNVRTVDVDALED
jgi:uncharacterized membrane protein YkoI